MQVTGDLVQLADFDPVANLRFCLTKKYPDLTNTSGFKTTLFMLGRGKETIGKR